MTPLTFVPLMLTILGAAMAPLVARSQRPKRAAQALTTVTVAAAVSSAAALVLVMLAALDSRLAVHVAAPLEANRATTPVQQLVDWCGELYDHRAPTWAATAAAVLLAVGAVRVVASHRRWHRAIRPWIGAGPVEIVPRPSTVAFAVPAPANSIVIGQALLDELDGDERRALLTHERAHLNNRHHRYVRAGELAGAVFPYLQPLAHQIRLATERWADEQAAIDLGDRELVAQALIKASLASMPASPLPNAAGGHVTTRVHALLDEQTTTRARHCVRRTSLVSIGLTLVAASIQLHHLAVFVQHMVHGDI